MANIHTVLDAVITAAAESKKVQITGINRSEYETIRTRLVTLWNEHKNTLLAIGGEDDPIYPLSLCSSYEEERADDDTGDGSSRAEYWLGKPRRKMAKSYSFSIVETQDEISSATLVEAANEPTTTPQLPTSKIAE